MASYRGYIQSRAFLGERVPQSVQNLVIRDYCRRTGIQYLLSVVEYCRPHTYFMLNALLTELPVLDGIVAYSLFQLPMEQTGRIRVYDAIMQQGKSLHFALENLDIKTSRDVERMEDIWKVRRVMADCPGSICSSINSEQERQVVATT